MTPALLVSILVAAIGLLIVWSNPKRGVNRVAFTCSLQMSAWLLCSHLTMSTSQGLFWLRCASAIGAGLPMHFWVVKENIAGESARWWCSAVWRIVGWASVTALLGVIPLTEFYIPSHSTGARRLFGWGYPAYIILNLSLYVFLLVDTFRTSKRLSGARRLELQVWLVGGCLMTLAVFSLMALNAIAQNRLYIQLQPFVVLVFYAGTVLTITTHRIFDARQIILVATEKFILISVVSFLAYVIHFSLDNVFPSPLELLCTVAIAFWMGGLISRWLDRMFHFYPEATVARQEAFSISRRESKMDALENGFSSVLKGWGQTDRAFILSGGKEGVSGKGIQLAHDAPVLLAMQRLRWATPERLARERTTPDREAVQAFLGKHTLGVLVIGEGPALTALIGVGVAASRRPFTYPQVTQLMELASIMESALERAHFSVKAQHAEQLATVGLLGASLAHEIRNPLVTIKTFVQLLPRHYQDDAFRQKFFTLIGSEVSRIDRLTEQLLDMASPRAYHAEVLRLHPVLHTSLELVMAKATDNRIEFITVFDAEPDHALTDASAIKQVLLNLCFNAIQAVEPCEDARWVKVGTRNVPEGIEISVEDSGPGIAPEIRPRLFQPFHSTKSSGFGLGLAICSDILASLNATITVDPSVTGRGALFRVVIPCPA